MIDLYYWPTPNGGLIAAGDAQRMSAGVCAATTW